jgi:transposase-like protein
MRKAKAATRRQLSAEEKIRIVMEGIRGEEPVSQFAVARHAVALPGRL